MNDQVRVSEPDQVTTYGMLVFLGNAVNASARKMKAFNLRRISTEQ